mgnify:CR=1 FL=1
MSEFVLTNGKLYLGGYDLSGQINSIAADLSVETPETTAMGVAAKQRLPGLKDAKISLNGFFSEEQILFTATGAVVSSAMTIAPTGADNETCWFFKPAMAKYSYGGKIGDVTSYKVEGEGAGPFVQGTILLPSLQRTETGTGVPRELGAGSAVKTIYGVLHVFAATPGPDTIDVIVQSDALATFLSPTDVITFAQRTTVGHEWKTAAGTVSGADTWWRISYAIGGGSPAFTFAVVVGIL